MSVREAEGLARKGAATKKGSGPQRAAGKDADTLSLENDLSEALGLDVAITDNGGAGEIRIRYETLEQLDDLCRRLTRG